MSQWPSRWHPQAPVAAATTIAAAAAAVGQVVAEVAGTS